MLALMPFFDDLRLGLIEESRLFPAALLGDLVARALPEPQALSLVASVSC